VFFDDGIASLQYPDIVDGLSTALPEAFFTRKSGLELMKKALNKDLFTISVTDCIC